ncbi:two component signal transductions sytem response regulator with GGDEF domain [Cyanobacterium sp. HL-69]|uniref:diguanylate cyclase n=1 Tax=Cyanobacterium sp. HL-69 TaxID=2054282 RepID=UPI000CA2EC2E|nr:two component signal transductions sytem response regulator with GGDEF domain [Cyanobacterium sp. HL-69]
MTFDELSTENDLIGSILIVDDQPANLRVLATMLKGKKYKVKKAQDGETALMAALSNPPDLILLDILMPIMHGYEVCQKLKSNPLTQHIPVIFISALNDVFDKIKAFEIGAVDYITKPFQEEEVLARINSQLTIQAQKRLLEKDKKLLQIKQQKLEEEIKQRKEAELILSQSRAFIFSILNSSLDGIAALEAVRNDKTGEIEDFRCVLVNPITANFFNLKTENLIDKLLFKEFINKKKYDLLKYLVKVVENDSIIKKDIKLVHNRKKNWFHITAVKLGDGFSITIRDITARKNLELKLNRLATIDSLTNVYNRQSFDFRLKNEWFRCDRAQKPLSLILCDVDYFKLYNDFYGHQAGDKCLKTVASIMDTIAKRSSDFLARYGGEEFAIILPNTPSQGALIIANTIKTEVENAHLVHHKSKISQYITLSLGVATVTPSCNYSPEDLLNSADKALYKAKKNGRNRVVADTLNPL